MAGTHPQRFWRTTYPSGDTQQRSNDLFDGIEETLRNPDQADGWTGILIPAVATGLAIALIRRRMG